MNEISRQVSRAHQRLFIGQFFRILCWAVFAGLMIAAIGLAVPKIWHLGFLETASNQATWNWSWIGGGLLLGLIVASTMAWFGRESRLTAAVEIDQRFGLKERISSALAIDESIAQSEVGQALIKDASEKAQTIDVRDKFGFHPNWKAALPILSALVLVALMFVPNAVLDKKADAKEPTKLNTEQVKVAVEQAKKKLIERAKDVPTKGLKDALEKLDSLDKKLDNMSKGDTEDKKESLVKLNDIKKQLEDRQKQLGGTNELKKNFKKLSDVGKSPAKQLAEAMKSGDLEEAQKAIKNLADKLKKGQLSETEKKKLAKDLKNIADQLNKMADQHEKAKQELKEKIKQAQQRGDLNKAAELQQQLEKKQQQDQQQQKMKKMAENLQKCADCMNQGQQNEGGNPRNQAGQPGNQQGQAELKKAGQALQDLAEQMEEMQQELEELEGLEDLAKDLEDIKNAMNDCQGEGDGGGDEPKFQDWAKGSGRGMGKREKGEGETGGYKSSVKAKLQKGETVVTGSADGNNISGRSVSEAKEIVASSMNKDSDPLENQKLPKSLREHAREYFQQMRGN